MGICHMYKFTSFGWHYCTYNDNSRAPLTCHKREIKQQLQDVQTKQYEAKEAAKKKQQLEAKNKL